MDRHDILTRAGAWTQAQEWKTKLAKRRGGVYPECSRKESNRRP